MYTRGQCGSDGWVGAMVRGRGGARLVIGFFKWQCKIDEWRRVGAVVAWMEM